MNRLRRWSVGLGAACLLLAVPAFTFAQAVPAAVKDAAKKGGKVAPSSPVDINSASQADLEKVPGIGAATAKKIIGGRPYSSVADLSKAGLSAKQVTELAPMLKAGAASAAPAAAAKAAAPVTTAAAGAATTAKTATSAAASTAKTATAAAAGSQTCAADMVWLNTETKVYHKSGDKYFANTKHGKCLTEADAQKAGGHLSKQK